MAIFTVGSLAANGRHLAKHVLISQTLVAIVVSAVWFAFFGTHAGLSASTGAIICLLPSVVFAHFAFRYAGASKNELVVRSFNQGSKLKFILTVILFVVAFKGLNADPLPLFTGYAITLVTQWVAMLVFNKKAR